MCSPPCAQIEATQALEGGGATSMHRKALARLGIGPGDPCRRLSLNRCAAWRSEKPAGRSREQIKLTSLEALLCACSKTASLARGGGAGAQESSFAYEFNLIVTPTYFGHRFGHFPSNLALAGVKWACFGLASPPCRASEGDFLSAAPGVGGTAPKRTSPGGYH